MGRQRLTCNVGDIFGCFEVLEPPYIRGEHSFVHVKCTICERELDLCLSEIKYRVKQYCQYCRGKSHQIYDDPKIGEVYRNWKIIEGKQKIKGFWCFNASCLNCRHSQYIRKDLLLFGPSKCHACREKVMKVKREKIKRKQEIRRNQPFITMFNHMCAEAGKRSIIVDISPEDLKEIYENQNHYCAITGDYLPDIRKASIDRIDSSKGYIKGNVQITTKQANLSKHIMTMLQLYEFCRKVLNHANQQPSISLTTDEGSETRC